MYDEVKENQGVVEQNHVHVHTAHHTAGWYREPREHDTLYTDEGIVRDYRSPIPNPHAHYPDDMAPGGRDSESECEQLQTHAHGGGGQGNGAGNYNSFSSFRPQTHVYESPLAQ